MTTTEVRAAELRPGDTYIVGMFAVLVLEATYSEHGDQVHADVAESMTLPEGRGEAFTARLALAADHVVHKITEGSTA